ncbi:MAG: TonB-dependent receptor [Cellvibrionaceae bacterium]
MQAKSNKPKSFFLSSLATTIGALSASQGLASTSPLLEEISITAEKRETSLQKTAISVSAFDANLAEALGITDLASTADHTPGLSVSAFSIGQPQAYIRGMGSNEDGAGGDSSIAIYLDGVYISRPSAANLEYYDIERIEVLRGPQGTLYGKNATGGVINVISAKPQDEFSGKIKVSVGNLDFYGLQARANIPLSNNLWSNFSLSKKSRDGYVKNLLTGNNLQDIDDQNIRTQLRYKPNETLDMIFAMDYETVDRLSNGRDGRGATESLYDDDPFTTTSDQDGYQQRESKGGRLEMIWDAPDGTLTSLTGYRKSQFDWQEDVIGLPDTFPGLQGVNAADDSTEEFSQEFRFATTDRDGNFVQTGLYFLHENAHRMEDISGFINPPGLPFSNRFDQKNTLDSYAVFADSSTALTEEFTLHAGIRYSYEEKDYSNEGSGFAGIHILLTENFFIEENEDWESASWRLSLDYQPTDSVLLYLSHNTGFKSGGFQGQAQNSLTAAMPFEQEEAENTEFGFKINGDNWNLNSTVFYSRYNDLQTLFFVQVTPTTFLATTTTEDAESKGLELEYRWQISEHFSSFGNYTYNDTRLLNAGSITDNKLRNAPRNSGSANLQWQHKNSSGNTLSATISYNFKDKTFQDLNNFEVNQFDRRELWNANISYTSASYKASLFGNNLNNEVYKIHSFELGPNSAYPIYGAPRTYGINLEMEL